MLIDPAEDTFTIMFDKEIALASSQDVSGAGIVLKDSAGAALVITNIEVDAHDSTKALISVEDGGIRSGGTYSIEVQSGVFSDKFDSSNTFSGGENRYKDGLCTTSCTRSIL